MMYKRIRKTFLKNEITIGYFNSQTFPSILEKLEGNEHLTKELSPNSFFFKRQKLSSNDVSDKIGIFRRTQYFGYCTLAKDQIEIQINFRTQFWLVFISLIPPSIMIGVLYPPTLTSILSLICSYFIIGISWYEFSKKIVTNRFMNNFTK